MASTKNSFSAEFLCVVAGAKLSTPIMLITDLVFPSFLFLMKFGSNMTSRIRSRHSRSSRGPNDIQYQLAQFHCGTHDPMERERVCRETQPEDIDFGDPQIACKERVIPEHWQSAHQRTNSARQAHPVRECLLTTDPRGCGSTTDLTTAQMFIQGNRLPRTPPQDTSPRRLGGPPCLVNG